jgi:DNA-binding beta-propeller fold protein YncE
VTAEFLYVGTADDPLNFPHNGPNQILGFPIDLNTGALGPSVSVPTTSTVPGLVADPTGKFLYASDNNIGNIRGFSINPSTGALAEIAGSPFPARPDGLNVIFGGMLITDIQGGFVYQVGSQIDGLAKSDTGALTPFLIFPPRSALMATVDPGNAFVYAPGCASQFELPVCVYAKNSAGGLTKVSTNPIPSLMSQGANSVAVTPVGGFVYASGGTASSFPPLPTTGIETVLSFVMDTQKGILSPLPSTVTNLESGALVFTDIAMHPSGKFLYVNTQDHVFGFAINSQGALTPVPGSPFPGKFAGNRGVGFRLDATGNFLYEALFDPTSPTIATSGIVGFRIDQTTGALTPLPGSPFSIGHIPMALAIAHIP